MENEVNETKVINASSSNFSGSISISQIKDFPKVFTPSEHNQSSRTITSMSGYSRPSVASRILETDSLNTAIGKLEAGILNSSGGGGSAGVSELLFQVTYSELVNLRDQGGLIPGAQYKITDYVTTTSDPNTISSGYKFNLIVVADSENKLNEKARACSFEGESYFSNKVDFSSWEIKYLLDNNTERFSWASSSGTGVIYEMKDEYGNTAPYDFKNIKFKRFKITTCVDNPDLVGKYLGVKDASTYTINENDFKYYYSFSWVDSYGEIYDSSVFAQNLSGIGNTPSGVIGNKISLVQDRNNSIDSFPRFKLPNIVILASAEDNAGLFHGMNGNEFKMDCRDITIVKSSSFNSFSQNIDRILFDGAINSCIFENSLSDILLKSSYEIYSCKICSGDYNSKFIKLEEETSRSSIIKPSRGNEIILD